MSNQELFDRHFLNIQLSSETLDAYVPRRAILNAIRSWMANFSGTLLDVGCGQMPYRKMICDSNPSVSRYIGLDLASSSIHDTSVADLHWDGTTIPLPDGSVSSAMATEVLEHCFDPDATLKEINRVLQTDGSFFFTVPFIWPLHEVPYDAYRYTPFSLRQHLQRAGFTDIHIHSLGGWHASFAQMIGLWARESKLTGFKKKLAVKSAKRLIPLLLKWDVPDHNFGQHCMSTGFYGWAKKTTS
jgi:SAM-dependent methyltransferase